MLLLLCVVSMELPAEPVGPDKPSKASLAEQLVFEKMEMPLKGLQIPLAVHRNGEPKTLLMAGLASHPTTNGNVYARHIEVVMKDENGKITARGDAERCIFNQLNGAATSEGRVRVLMEGMMLTGQGFDWSKKGEEVLIHEDVKVVLNRKRLMKGRVASVLKPK